MDKIHTILNKYEKTLNIPHLLFYGNPYSGKRKTIYKLLEFIYNKEHYKKYTLFIECSFLKGIKTIRENIKDFAKQQSNVRVPFKSIILFDADYLTNEAQFSLRRIIELYSSTTRFFIITSNKNKLINPILSRFIDIYFYETFIEEEDTTTFSFIEESLQNNNSVYELTNLFYEEYITGDNIVNYFKYKKHHKYLDFSMLYNSLSLTIKSETLIILFILHYFL